MGSIATSYDALITRIQTSPHPNADKVQCGKVSTGETVIVGKEVQDGAIGIYFPVGCQLSVRYCAENDLIARYDEAGKKINSGYFDSKRRVKAQPFRGTQSHGLWMPMSSLLFTGTDRVLTGTSLSELNGHELCRKYMTTAQENVLSSVKKKLTWRQRLWKWMSIEVDAQVRDFPEHFDTPKYVTSALASSSGHLIVTEKLHGTSHRVGRVLVTHPLSVWKQLVNKLVPILSRPIGKYETVHGTRRTVLYPHVRHAETFRLQSADWDSVAIHMRPDEIVYGEIVGYSGLKPIMQDHEPKTTKLKPNYGTKIRYSYGCQPGECKFYVYRITLDGRELSWLDVKQRAAELGLDTVPEIATTVRRWWADRTLWESSIKTSYDKRSPSFLDSAIEREGVVIRIETLSGTRWMKDKAWAFLVMEGVLQDNDSYVDAEDVA